MPAFYILLIVSCGLVWILLSSLYKPIGKFFCRIFKDAKEEMAEEDLSETDKLNKSTKEIYK